ncbi:F0F1 ATP synthase subunit delta [Streptomyces sp. NBC_01803]|uniref:F0F1 ATP synthase subunit delta n=1 Tax=Streptomyces sp. NBC_01803 TaxID=2975946 RepID=UPI002DD94D45|nr:F0F1 ATP synthase subunit delta [Streptomyces sp. NBC_01803]WSA44177.1 F0F1 ATP synthase subunit delta [Streptomyces sp. NBC_01803]
MMGASREALDAARERLVALTDNTGVDAAALATDLAAVTGLLDRETSLRRVLTDPAQAGERKAELVRRLLTGQVGGEAVDLVSGTVRSRWSSSRGLVDAIEELADTADLIAAERAGVLDSVEDELFRFGRVVSTSPELRAALSVKDDSPAAVSAKAGLVRELLSGRVQAVTERLVIRLVERPRGRSLDAGLNALSTMAAARRNRSVAVVTSAVPLDDRQRQRLGDALARLYGRPVQLNLDVDPAVVGGISVRIGDEVIHGTVADRLDEVNRRMAG